METATATTSPGDAQARSGRLAMSGSSVFWVAAGLVAAGIAIRFSTLGLQSYHHDEVITVARVLPGSLGHMLHEVRRSESTPPLYYILAWEWSRHLGLHEVELRSLSAIFGVLTIPVAYFVGKELVGKRVGLLTMAMVAFNPMMIWYSQEARAYSLMVLLCSASLWFFLRFRRTGSILDIALWGVSSALAITSHYFSAFPVAIEAGWLLYEHRRNRGVWIALGGIAATGLALLPLASHQANPTHIDWIGHLGIGNRIADTGASFLIGETGRVIGAANPRYKYAVVPLLLVGLLYGAALFRGRTREWRPALIGIAIAFGSFVLALLAAAAGKDYVLARNLLPALLPLLAATAVVASFPRLRVVGLAAVAALCVYWLAFDVYVDATPNLQRPDWKSVAKTVHPTTRPRVLVTWTLGTAPLEYYLHDGTVRAKTGPFDVSEVDVVSKASAARFRSPLTPLFPKVKTTDLGRFDVTRYIAPHPVLLGLHLLRHMRTGFPTNAVMIGGGSGIAPGLTQPGVTLQSSAYRLKRRHLLHELHRIRKLRQLDLAHNRRQLRHLQRLERKHLRLKLRRLDQQHLRLKQRPSG